MISEKQLEANRRNAQLSTGPKTQEGKARVSANAITHGLRAETFVVVPGEDQEQFNAKLDAWNRSMRPSNEAQSELVRRMVIDSWMLDRAERHEGAILTRNIMEALNACECEDDDVPALREAAALASFDASNEGERLRRYQSSTHRSLLRTIDTFLKMRRDEQKEKEQEIRANKANSQAQTAPNKANSQPVAAQAPNKAISPAVQAPNKAISTPDSRPLTPIGARELDRFLSEPLASDPFGSLSVGFSPLTR